MDPKSFQHHGVSPPWPLGNQGARALSLNPAWGRRQAPITASRSTLTTVRHRLGKSTNPPVADLGVRAMPHHSTTQTIMTNDYDQNADYKNAEIVLSQ